MFARTTPTNSEKNKMDVTVTTGSGQQPDIREPDRPPGMLEVNVSSAAELDEALENAVSLVMESATHHKIGVMITRIGIGSYVVRAHPAVPYGLVRQQHA